MFDANKLRGILSQIPGVGKSGGRDSVPFGNSTERNRAEYEDFSATQTDPDFQGYSGQESFSCGQWTQEDNYDDYNNTSYQRQAMEMLNQQKSQGSLDFPPEDSGENLDEHGAERAKISPLQAAWNVTNAIQGMFIVSLPYAVLHGGWWGVGALGGVAAVCYYTGILLVECLYEDGRRVRNSYRAVAEDCWGRPWGGRIVLGAQLTELLMTCILYVVLCGDLMEGSFPDLAMDKMGWMLLASAVLLPCAFLMNLRAVSWLSFWNAVSHVIINMIIIFYCLSQMGSWDFLSVSFGLNVETFPTVLGIVVFSYTSHIFLPSLEGSLTERSAFKPMLKWSHVVAAIFKASFGLIGFLTFQEFTEEEVTNNLPSQNFKIIVNLILVVKALLSYPLPYFAAVQIIQEEFFRGKPRTQFPTCLSADGTMREWALALRICLVLFTLFMALSIPHFALLMGLVGNITGTMLSFVWPSLFHLHLKGAAITGRQRTGNTAIIFVGILLGLVGIYFSSLQLSRAM